MTPEERAAKAFEAFADLADKHPTLDFDERLGEAIAGQIREAVAAERERCARLVESFDLTADGEHVTPGLGYWRDPCGRTEYVPDADAIAAFIRKGGAV